MMSYSQYHQILMCFTHGSYYILSIFGCPFQYCFPVKKNPNKRRESRPLTLLYSFACCQPLFCFVLKRLQTTLSLQIILVLRALFRHKWIITEGNQTRQIIACEGKSSEGTGYEGLGRGGSIGAWSIRRQACRLECLQIQNKYDSNNKLMNKSINN